MPERLAYSMSKGAVLSMTMSIAVDYMKRNIRCNCICPARIHTPFVDGFVAAHYPGREEETLRRLANHGVEVWRTDEDGAVTVFTDGESVQVRSARRSAAPYRLSPAR